MRYINAQTIEDIALGAAVLGSGGGGDPYLGMLMGLQAVETYGPLPLATLDEVEDDALVLGSAMMGAPTVMVEKLPNGTECVNAVRAMENYYGRKATAIMPMEVGGVNSLVALPTAAQLGVPILDVDGMGRAFPEIQMFTATVFGYPATPMALSDEKGNSAIINTVTNRWTETLARTLCIDMGCVSMITAYPTTGKQLKEWGVRGTLTFAEKIGATIRQSRSQSTDVVAEVRKVTNGFEVFRGKIVDVQRRTETGFARGELIIDGVDGYGGQTCKIAFQNENLVAFVGDEALVVTPDLISVLDTDTGVPITTEGLRYGYRVTVLGIPCDARWRLPKGLEIVGPQYFGYDVPYVPIEQRLAR
jgi:uncharacterized protein